MKRGHLQKIIDGPVYLLEGNDGRVYGNSQFLAKEVLRLRDAIKELQREAQNAGKNGCCLTEKAIHEWGNAALGEPSLADLKAGRTNQ